jgi:hypothetical protein
MRHDHRDRVRAVSFSGINAKEALRLARKLGCHVKHVPGTGEKRIVHSDVLRSVKINGRRHDAGRELTTFLRRVALITEVVTATPSPARRHGNGNGDGRAAIGAVAGGQFDQDGCHDLIRGLTERFQLSVEQLIAEAEVGWLIMKLWRLMQGQQRWTPQLVAPFVPVIARRTALSTSEVWAFLGGSSAPDALVELCRCRFYHPTKAHMQQLIALIDDDVASATTWTALATTIPPYLMPEQPMRRSLRAWASTSDAARDAVHLWLRPACHIREKILPIDPDEPGLRGFGLLVEDSFIRSLAAKDMLRFLNAENFFDLMSSTANDLVGHYGNVIARIDRQMLNFDPSIAHWFESVEDVLIFDDRLMIYRKSDAPVWFACVRTGDPKRDRFLDERVAAVGLLREAVIADGWDVRQSFCSLDGFY